MDSQKRILIVDDDKIHRIIYSTIAQKMNYSVDHAGTRAEAEAALSGRSYFCVVLDLMLGEESGKDVLSLVRSAPGKPAVVLVTGAPQDVVEQTLSHGRALGLDVFGPVRKPVNVTLIRDVLRSVEDVTAKRVHLTGEPTYAYEI